MLPYQKETDKSTDLTSEQAVRYREKRRVKMVNIQSNCPILLKKFSSLHQKVPNNAEKSLRHRIKSYKLQLHLYISNLQIRIRKLHFYIRKL